MYGPRKKVIGAALLMPMSIVIGACGADLRGEDQVEAAPQQALALTRNVSIDRIIDDPRNPVADVVDVGGSVAPFHTSGPNTNPPSQTYGFTAPVTHTYNYQTPYTVLLNNIIGLSSARTWTLVDPLNQDGFFYATRGLASETVAATVSGAINDKWIRLTISDQP